MLACKSRALRGLCQLQTRVGQRVATGRGSGSTGNTSRRSASGRESGGAPRRQPSVPIVRASEWRPRVETRALRGFRRCASAVERHAAASAKPKRSDRREFSGRRPSASTACWAARPTEMVVVVEMADVGMWNEPSTLMCIGHTEARNADTGVAPAGPVGIDTRSVDKRVRSVTQQMPRRGSSGT